MSLRILMSLAFVIAAIVVADSSVAQPPGMRPVPRPGRPVPPPRRPVPPPHRDPRMEVVQIYYGGWVFNGEVIPILRLLNLGPYYHGFDLVSVEMDVDGSSQPGRPGVDVVLMVNGHRYAHQNSGPWNAVAFEMRGIQRLGIEVRSLQAQVTARAFLGTIRATLRRPLRR